MSECCDDMEYFVNYECPINDHDWAECADFVMHKGKSITGEIFYGIPIHDDGSSVIFVSFCPWCGKFLGVNQEEALTDQP